MDEIMCKAINELVRIQTARTSEEIKHSELKFLIKRMKSLMKEEMDYVEDNK